LILCGFFLTSCSTGSSDLVNEGLLVDDSIGKIMESVDKSKKTNLAARIPNEKVNSVPRKLTAAGIKAMDQRNFEKASKLFNAALKLDVRNSYLHFLNALSYHQRALQGESQLYALSEQGYLMAQKFDPSNWLSKYYLGLAKLDQGNYRAAKVQFASAVPYRDTDPQVLYHLAATAYYDHDVRTADAALRRLRQLNLQNAVMKKRVAASSALVAVAQNLPGEAQRNYSDYSNLTGQGQATWLSQRMDSWGQVHKAVAQTPQPKKVSRSDSKKYWVAQLPGSGAPPGTSDFPGSFQTPESTPDPIPEPQVIGSGFNPGDSAADPKMVVVDVTIIRTEEDTSSSKGINLLSGLQIQFGDPLSAIPGISFGRNRTEDFLPQQNDAINTRTITKLIGIPAITYSLNIANSQRGRNEVLARPTLVARAGKTSEFFSGVEVLAAATSGGAGDSVSIEKEIGVKLAVTPEFLPSGMLLLRVRAERTFLTQPNSSVVFEFRLDTSKTVVNADVAMRFGQTLILSGLSERETERDKQGVPGVQRVPVAKLLFSQERKRSFKKSVMILLTPRRAQFLHKTVHDNPANARSYSERRIRELEQRYRAWFRPLSHTARIFQELRSNSLYLQEYRSGDIAIDNWHSGSMMEEQVGEALRHIYK
jgi:general secretion pathway protein D